MSHTFRRRFSLTEPLHFGASPGRLEALLFLLAYWGPPRLRSRDAMASLSLSLDWAVVVSAAVWLSVGLWVFNEFNVYALRHHRLPRMSRQVRLGVVFGLALCLSATVSVSPVLSAYKALQLLAGVLFGYFWVLKYGARDALKRLVVGAASVTALILLLGVLSPSLVWVGGRLKGGVMGSGGTAATLLIVGILSGIRFHRPWVSPVLLTLGTLLLGLSQVRTGYVAVGVCALVLALKGGAGNRSRRLVAAVASAAPLLIASEMWGSITRFLIRDSYSVATLSDRTPLWSALLAQVWEASPVLGVGFYSMRTMTLAYNPGIGTAHSAYVEVAGGSGLIGAATMLLLIMAVGAGLLRSSAAGPTDLRRLSLGLFLACLIMGLTSEEMVTGGAAMLTFVMLVATSGDRTIEDGVVTS